MVAYPHNMQNLTSDCGIAVIKSLLENYHRFNERSFKSVVSSLDIEQGLSLFNIEEVLKQFGVYGSSYEVEDFHLLDFTKPMILLVDSNGENHYILLYGVKDGKAIVSDPSHAVLEQVNLNELKGVFKGYVFIIENVVERTHQEKLLQKHSHVKKNLKLHVDLLYLTVLLCIIPIIIIFSIQYFLIYQLRNLVIWQVLVIFIFETLLTCIYVKLKTEYNGIVSNEDSLKQEALAFSFLEDIDQLSEKDENIYNRLIKFWNNFNASDWQLKRYLSYFELVCVVLIFSATFAFSRGIALLSIVCMLTYVIIFKKGIVTRKNYNRNYFNNMGELSVFIEESIHNKLDRSIFSSKEEVSTYLKSILLKVKDSFAKQRESTAHILTLYDGVMYLNLSLIFVYVMLMYSIKMDMKVVSVFISFVIVYMVYSLGKPAIQKFLDLERYSSLDSHYRKPPAIDRNNAADFTITGISLENVSVSYSQDTSVSVLSGISKQFRSHSLILVKGKNGIGKSTLMYVIMGVVPVSGGSVHYYDSDRDLYGYPIEMIQSRISCYQQNQFLNYASIGKNVAYDIYKNARQPIDNIFKLDLDKIIFYNGVNLSQGERQKVLLSRSLNKEADVYIFDEPTSNLDDSSKKIFIDKVLELKKTAMIFIVTHDAMFDKIADEIIDLDVIKK